MMYSHLLQTIRKQCLELNNHHKRLSIRKVRQPFKLMMIDRIYHFIETIYFNITFCRYLLIVIININLISPTIRIVLICITIKPLFCMLFRWYLLRHNFSFSNYGAFLFQKLRWVGMSTATHLCVVHLDRWLAQLALPSPR